MAGGSIMCMELASLKLKFKDSLNFFYAPLSALSKMFELEEVKGFFPHKFNTRQNAGYVGPLPPAEYFAPDFMSVKGRAAFRTWYAEQEAKGEPYDLEKIKGEYCESDVKVLAGACLKFVDITLERSHINPLMSCITLASLALKDYRQNHMLPNTIGSLPLQGYREKGVHSVKSLHWFYSLKECRAIHWETFRCALHPEGEKELFGCRVDGYDETSGKYPA